MESSRNPSQQIADTVESGIRAGAFPGAVVAVAGDGGAPYIRAFGRSAILPVEEGMREDMLFDLASVTKVVATTTSVMILCDRGKLSLADRVAEFIPEFSSNGKGEITVMDLLTHASGLPDWSDLYVRHATKRAIVDEISSMSLVCPTGSKVIYSDLGFIVLGELVERVSGDTLDRFVRRELTEPLGMNDTMFNPPPEMTERCVPTEYSNWRLSILRGQVHDENAFAMGGVSGHAGLFSSAPDLIKFGAMVYGLGASKGRRVLSAESVETMVEDHTGRLNESRGLGWLIEPEFTGQKGYWRIAHNGYTGTSIAISIEHRAFAALLTNRVHPVRDGSPPSDRSVGIMMERRNKWTDYLPKFYQLSAALLEERNDGG